MKTLKELSQELFNSSFSQKGFEKFVADNFVTKDEAVEFANAQNGIEGDSDETDLKAFLKIMRNAGE